MLLLAALVKETPTAAQGATKNSTIDSEDEDEFFVAACAAMGVSFTNAARSSNVFRQSELIAASCSIGERDSHSSTSGKEELDDSEDEYR